MEPVSLDGPPRPEGHRPGTHRLPARPANPRTSQLIPLVALVPEALDKVTTVVGGPVWTNFLANVYAPPRPKRVGKQYNQVQPCPAPRAPLIPLAAKQTLEDMLLNRNASRVNCKNLKISSIPNIDELNRITKGGTCMVNNFIVTHEDLGNMTFCGNADVYGIDLDNLWDADKGTVNFDFNFPVPTRVVNKNIWPKDRTGRILTDNRDTRVFNYWTSVQRACELKKGCTYIGYDHIHGVAQFNIGEIQDFDREQEPA